jgi:hypothetical protein
MEPVFGELPAHVRKEFQHERECNQRTLQTIQSILDYTPLDLRQVTHETLGPILTNLRLFPKVLDGIIMDYVAEKYVMDLYDDRELFGMVCTYTPFYDRLDTRIRSRHSYVPQHMKKAEYNDPDYDDSFAIVHEAKDLECVNVKEHKSGRWGFTLRFGVAKRRGEELFVYFNRVREALNKLNDPYELCIQGHVYVGSYPDQPWTASSRHVIDSPSNFADLAEQCCILFASCPTDCGDMHNVHAILYAMVQRM